MPATQVRCQRCVCYMYLECEESGRCSLGLLCDFYVNGLKEDRIRMQWAEIDAVQKTYTDIRILKCIEADILPDGTMGYADGLLAQFDFVTASVHSRFNLPEEQQTKRIWRALANLYVTMLGHPTGRLLLSRAGIASISRKSSRLPRFIVKLSKLTAVVTGWT